MSIYVYVFYIHMYIYIYLSTCRYRSGDLDVQKPTDAQFAMYFHNTSVTVLER